MFLINAYCARHCSIVSASARSFDVGTPSFSAAKSMCYQGGLITEGGDSTWRERYARTHARTYAHTYFTGKGEDLRVPTLAFATAHDVLVSCFQLR